MTAVEGVRRTVEIPAPQAPPSSARPAPPRPAGPPPHARPRPSSARIAGGRAAEAQSEAASKRRRDPGRLGLQRRPPPLPPLGLRGRGPAPPPGKMALHFQVSGSAPRVPLGAPGARRHSGVWGRRAEAAAEAAGPRTGVPVAWAAPPAPGLRRGRPEPRGGGWRAEAGLRARPAGTCGRGGPARGAASAAPGQVGARPGRGARLPRRVAGRGPVVSAHAVGTEPERGALGLELAERAGPCLRGVAKEGPGRARARARGC